jgi:hypothetical protein
MDQTHLIETEDSMYVVKDISFGEDRVIIFTSRTCLKLLGKGVYWMMEGTFKVTPSQFYQVYTIHSNVFQGSKAFPMLIALLSGKNQQKSTIKCSN